MRISQEKIEEIRSLTDIVEVVGEYVSLKKRGSHFFGLCPFHQEKTPSFSVNPSLGIYKCFGCGKGGDVFNFLMEIEGIRFIEAVRLLAEKAGIPLPESAEEMDDEVNKLFHVLRFAARFYHQQLVASDEGRREGLRYFMEERRFSSDTIQRFGLGYAPRAWDALIQAAAEAHISSDLLEQAGLVVRKGAHRTYDRFRHRVIFPIFSPAGQVLGFGGRRLDPSDPAKYINSPETPVYHKSKVLYGLYQAKQAIRQKGEALLVEGYTDVITLSQAGVEHVVATSGTALTRHQVRLLKRYASSAVLVFDGDVAGVSAMLRGILPFLEEGMGVYFLTLPAGSDPDTWVREHGKEAFQEYLQRNRQDFIAFRIAQARASGQWNVPENQAAVIHEILRLIHAIDDPIRRNTYVHRLSEISHIPDIHLFEQLERLHTRPVRERRKSRQRVSATSSAPKNTLPTAENGALPSEQTLIRLMLTHGKNLVEHILGTLSLEEFTPGVARRTIEYMLQQYEELGDVKREPFVDGTYGQDIQHFVTELLIDRHEPSPGWFAEQGLLGYGGVGEDPYAVADSAMRALRLYRVEEKIEVQRALLYQRQAEGDDVRSILEGLKVLQQIKEKIRRGQWE